MKCLATNYSNKLLEATDLQKRFHGKAVLDGLSFHIHPGEVIGLLGPNGAGKTTAFYIVMGLIAPDGGQIFFQGEAITHKPVHLRAKMGIGYLAQEPSVFRSLSVEDNIQCILETLPLSKQQRKERLTQLLSELNLEYLRKKKASSLSGGQRRRVEITRALIREPKLLLLDEPFANIDPLAIQEVKNLIRILKAKGISVLITDHNAREIFSIVDRSYLLWQGKVFLSGTVSELLSNQEARRSYFGEDFRL